MIVHSSNLYLKLFELFKAADDFGKTNTPSFLGLNLCASSSARRLVWQAACGLGCRVSGSNAMRQS